MKIYAILTAAVQLLIQQSDANLSNIKARLRKPLLLVAASWLSLGLATGAYSHPINGWLVSFDGTGPWIRLGESALDLEDLGFSDFNGDGHTDVIAAWGGEWRISFSGTSNWQTLNVSDVPISDMIFGDLNGDGKADVFTTWGGKWHVSFSGTGNWQAINTSSVEVSDILLGDFNGDGKADVFTTWGGQWHVSFSGTSNWQVINTSTVEVSDILLGDFDGDGKADVFTTWGGKWHISFSGASSWKDLNLSSYGVPDLRLGDFDGNGKTDVFTIGEDTHIGLSIMRHETASLTNAAADSILADATNVLQTNDGPDDNTCLVHFVRKGNVGIFGLGDGSIDSQGEFDKFYALNLVTKTKVFVVNQLNFCNGIINPIVIGCSPMPGDFQVVERFASKEEGILWAHEYGHTRGLKHRNDSTAVMNPTIDPSRRRVNSDECAAFHK